MKNQYLGDINDYRKYGLLRLLCEPKNFPLAICWMLTPSGENISHGNKIKYLFNPVKYRKYDPGLYDTLKNLDIVGGGDRNVDRAKKFLPTSCFFYEEIISDQGYKRERYFNTFFQAIPKYDLIFFDPDIGIEVKSICYGRKDSSRYI